MPEDLFSQDMRRDAPLSARMRPRTIEEFVGQRHILGPGKLLSRAVEADRLASLILYGPPGTGKTSLAVCISRRTRSAFERINAVAANVEDLRRLIASARHRQAQGGGRTIVFIDEIHRFNRAQQDVLMPDIEEGSLVLIGATVLNPCFALIGPLLSRSLIFELVPLSPSEIREILDRALRDGVRGLGDRKVAASGEALDFLAEVCDGDARRALNALEIGVLTSPVGPDGRVVFDLAAAQESIQRKQVRYDRSGDAHYDTASAFIKSMRGSDPDAAVYWLAKMICAGEDPRFIARRIAICAAEDVGNADPRALLVAQAAVEASVFLGMPEARIPLAQAALYVACAPKSNAAYRAIEAAMDDVRSGRTLEVPPALKDASYRGAGRLGRGTGYKYAHDFPGHHVRQDYLPEVRRYYEPSSQGFELRILERLRSLGRRDGGPGKTEKDVESREG